MNLNRTSPSSATAGRRARRSLKNAAALSGNFADSDGAMARLTRGLYVNQKSLETNFQATEKDREEVEKRWRAMRKRGGAMGELGSAPTTPPARRASSRRPAPPKNNTPRRSACSKCLAPAISTSTSNRYSRVMHERSFELGTHPDNYKECDDRSDEDNQYQSSVKRSPTATSSAICLRNHTLPPGIASAQQTGALHII